MTIVPNTVDESVTNPTEVYSAHHCDKCDVFLLDLAPTTKWDETLQEFILKNWVPEVENESPTEFGSGVDLGFSTQNYIGLHDVVRFEVGRFNFQLVIDGAEQGCEFFAWCREKARTEDEFAMQHPKQALMRISIHQPSFARITKPRTMSTLLVTLEAQGNLSSILGQLCCTADPGTRSNFTR